MPNNGISATNNNKNSKSREDNIPPNLVVLTYSVSTDLKETLFALNTRGASVHYIIEEDGKQIQFTNDLTQQTFCCGKSEFRGQTSLNQSSINVMLINDAVSEFKSEQTTKLIRFLQDIAHRYPYLDLKKNIVGLGEIAIQRDQPVPRHQAPGKYFPWECLSQQGFGLFLKTTVEQQEEIIISAVSTVQEIKGLQKKLSDYGYAIEKNGIYDDTTKAWVTRFNERYVPSLLKDATVKANDPSLWSKASQLSLEHVLGYLNIKSNISTQSASMQTSFFNQASIITDNSVDEVDHQTTHLNLK